MTVSWTAVFFAFAAVWQSSRRLGLPTWWLGPTSGPRPLLVQLIPFVAPAVAAICATWNARHLLWIGLAAGAATVGVALGDLGTVTRLAIVEGALGLAGTCATLAAALATSRRTAPGSAAVPSPHRSAFAEQAQDQVPAPPAR